MSYEYIAVGIYLTLKGTAAALTTSSAGSSGSGWGLPPSPPANCSEVIEVQLRIRTVSLIAVLARDCEDPEVLGHTRHALVGLQRAGATNADTGCATTSSVPNSAHPTIATLPSGGGGYWARVWEWRAFAGLKPKHPYSESLDALYVLR